MIDDFFFFGRINNLILFKNKAIKHNNSCFNIYNIQYIHILHSLIYIVNIDNYKNTANGGSWSWLCFCIISSKRIGKVTATFLSLVL